MQSYKQLLPYSIRFHNPITHDMLGFVQRHSVQYEYIEQAVDYLSWFGTNLKDWTPP